MSISLLSVLSPYPNPAEQPPSSLSSLKSGYLESCKATLKPKKRHTKRAAPKYTRHASRDQVQPRKSRKKAAIQSGRSSSFAGSVEQHDEDESRDGKTEGREAAKPLTVPRIDIVHASPTIGSKSPTPNANSTLERSPSMPAVLLEQTPEYSSPSKQAFRPSLTRPLTSPSTQTGETGSAACPGWGCPGAGTSGRIPLLPLPGTPAHEMAEHDFTSAQDEQGAPLHTCATDTTQSVPTTFHFQDTITSRSTSFPGRQQDDGKYAQSTTDHQAAPTQGGSKHSSRSTSLSSSVSRITNQVRVLRITNPDPPSPVRSAAPSRTPSMTIAQKRFVSCPPAPLQVERANGYKTTPNKISSFDSPVSRSTETPTSSSNSASTPSFRFSDGGRSPGSAATPTSALSSLPATPTKAGAVRPVDLEYDYKNSYSSAKAATEVAKMPAACTTASPITRITNAPKPTEVHVLESAQSKKRAKSEKKRRVRVKRSKSTSSRDADNSEGVESCFESVGAPSEWEYISPRKKRSDGQDTAKAKESKRKIKRKEVEHKLKSSSVFELAAELVQEPEEQKQPQKEDEPHIKQRPFFKPPKSPLVLSKPQVAAALDINNGRNLENLTTFWTPIGRVIIAPAPSMCASGLKMPSSPALVQVELVNPNKEQILERKTAVATRDFLVPPRSPRPPNTRRLGHNDRDPLSRSELYPPQYTKQDSLLAVPSSHNSAPNPALRLSLPLPSPMRLDAFTSDLLARCGGVEGGHDSDALLAEFNGAPSQARRRSVDEGVKEGARNMNETMQIRRALPAPGDPYVPSPSPAQTYRFPSGLLLEEDGQEMDISFSSSRPSLPHTHPATLRPSTPSQVYSHIPATPSKGRFFTQTPSMPLRESTGHKRHVSLPVPPPLPPRPRRNALPDVSVLREQLVANGALVSGDEGERCEYRDEAHPGHIGPGHSSHRHKTAMILDKSDLIIPIRKAFPDGAGMMEYERARSLRDAQMKTQMDHMVSLTTHVTPDTPSKHAYTHAQDHHLPNSPCARLEERLDRYTTAKGIQGYYCEEKGRSGFELLQRQSDDNGFIRERGQERGRGRDRNRRVHCDQGEQVKAMMQPEEDEQVAGDGEGEEENNGAVRLGEHKRGFDTCEIQRWLEGMKKASMMREDEDREDRQSFF